MVQMSLNKKYFLLLILSVPLALYLGVTNNNAFMEGYDKFVHFGVFLVETYLFAKSLQKFQLKLWRNWELNRNFVIVIVCFILASIGSEYFQHFVNPNRAFDIADIIANLLGTSVGYLCSLQS